MNPTVIFNFLNLVELFSYSLLFDIEFHIIFIEFMISLKKSTKLPSIKINIKRKERQLPKKYALYGIESSLILSNLGMPIGFILALTFITAVLHIGTLIKTRSVNQVFMFLRRKLFFGWFFRICLQGCFDFFIFCTLGLCYSNYYELIHAFALH